MDLYRKCLGASKWGLIKIMAPYGTLNYKEYVLIYRPQKGPQFWSTPKYRLGTPLKYIQKARGDLGKIRNPRKGIPPIPRVPAT